MCEQLVRNKQAAQAFYDLMFNQCRPAEAVERYVGDVYIQHNPMVARRQGRVRRVFHANGAGVPGQAGAL